MQTNKKNKGCYSNDGLIATKYPAKKVWFHNNVKLQEPLDGYGHRPSVYCIVIIKMVIFEQKILCLNWKILQCTSDVILLIRGHCEVYFTITFHSHINQPLQET
jgi:hypothetical protein